MTIGNATISAVSYLNTIPLVYGIEHAGLLRAALSLSPPSDCAGAFDRGEASVALVPSAALLSLDNCRVVTPFCIGADGDVRTVVIMSDTPVGEIRRLFLDTHSLTSVALSGILCRELWHVSPERVGMDDLSQMDNAVGGDAFLLIGDKVFEHEGRFRFTYDLARAWRELTGLPFVFAVWVARKDVPQDFIDALEASLGYGVGHVREAIAASVHSLKPYAYEYLTKNIDYNFNGLKRRSLELFLDKCRTGAGTPAHRELRL